MASPFRVFRKYQKTLLVVAGVILMFVFVIGDSLVGYLGRAQRAGGTARDATAVAVDWAGGSLTNAELDELVFRRRVLNSFLQNIEFAGRQTAFEAGAEPRPLKVQPLLGEETEESVVRTRLFAEAARDAGMRVSDSTIIGYLLELGRGNVTRDQMRLMLSRSGGARVPIDMVIDALREEMLARNYIASHQFAFNTVTPQQGWEDWLKVNDRIVIEAAALPAENFLVDVKEPTDQELAKFFEEHKVRETQPDPFVRRRYNIELPMPVPGFRIPRKINVQYLEANFEDVVAKIENEITEEEIVEYYEANKDPYFVTADTSLIDDDATPAEPAQDAAPADQPATPDAPESAESPASDPPAETPAPSENADGKSSAPAAEEEAKSDEQSQPEQTEPEQTDPEQADEADQASASKPRFRLAAFQNEEEGESASSDEPSDTPPAEDAAEETPEPPAEQNTPAAEDAPADEDVPADEDAAPATPPETSDDAPSTGAPEQAEPATQPDAPKSFQPLDEVRDLIRRQLAEQRAAEQLSSLMNEVASDLTAEFNTYFASTFDAQEDDGKTPEPPEALRNLEPVAQEHGLSHGETGPVSVLELRDLPVGQSGSTESGMPLWQVYFVDSDLEKYQPVQSMDIDGNQFVSMKTSDQPGRVPELAEIKDEVVQAWKLSKAAEIAKKRAEELAKKIEEADSTLADYFASDDDIDVVQTDPFSQETGGDVAFVQGQVQQQPLRLSQPDGLVAPGPEFMQRVFELENGEVAAVLNHDHSIAYVVRAVEHQDSPEELRQAYLAEAASWPGQRLMANRHAQEAANALVAEVVASAGLEWKRTPDEPNQDEG